MSGGFTVAAGEANTDVAQAVTIASPTANTWTKDSTAGITLQVLLMAATVGSIMTTTPCGRHRPAQLPAWWRPSPEGLWLVTSRSHFDDATQAGISQRRIRELKRSGSSLKFCAVA